MKKKKVKLRKKRIVIFIIIVIIFLLILFCFNNKGQDLKSLGYKQLEINEINKLTKSEINTILKYDYNSNLIYIIESENYNPNNLELYLKYTLKYKDINYLKIINLINNNDFNETKIDEYINFLKNYDNIDGIIKYVNNYKDLKYDDKIINLISEKYFKDEYLDRYLDYIDENSSLDYSEIVTRVNSNLDYEFYTDSKKSDISKGMYTLVNKYYYLDKNYVPDNLVSITGIYARDKTELVKDAYDAFIKMADAARKENLTIKATTCYRSYNFQSTLYNNYVKVDGVKNADTYSARPGYSEHQLGYSCDLTNKNNVAFSDFINTDEYKWLKDNAYKYGFIQRYSKEKEYITGYIAEPWHYRYVGTEISKYIYENNITYEEYYEYFLR